MAKRRTNARREPRAGNAICPSRLALLRLRQRGCLEVQLEWSLNGCQATTSDESGRRFSAWAFDVASAVVALSYQACGKLA